MVWSLIWVTRQPLCRYVHHTPAAKGDPVYAEALGLHAHTSTGSGRLRQKHTYCIKGIIALTNMLPGSVVLF